jgi:hypothetical protein
MSGEQKSGESKVQIPQLTSAKALVEGKTTGHISSGVSPPSPGARHARWGRYLMSGNTRRMGEKRTSGVLDEVEEHGKRRKAVTPIIKAIGRRNIPIRARMGVKEGKETIPTFLTERIKQLSKDPISDLTKTSLGAESQRKATGIKGYKSRKKDPQSAGKRKTKRKKRSRRRKTKRKRRTRRKRTRRRKR